MKRKPLRKLNTLKRFKMLMRESKLSQNTLERITTTITTIIPTETIIEAEVEEDLIIEEDQIEVMHQEEPSEDQEAMVDTRKTFMELGKICFLRSN